MLQADVRVPRAADYDTRVMKAAKASVKFIRTQVEMTYPENKEEMSKRVWELYFKMLRMKMLAAPRATRRLLREKYGFWSEAGVDARWPAH